jgi:HEAT repeat protein
MHFMDGLTVLRVAVTVVFALNGLMLAVILIVKPLHRARDDRHRRRRSTYIALLSRHLASDSGKVEMGRKVAEDQAFLDALIDLRSVIGGEEAEMLGDLVDRFDIARKQSVNLRRRIRTDRRLRAAVALAELADETAAPTLMAHLADSEQEVRVQCARGLGRMRWRPAITAILDRFETETPWVRSRFADSLVDYGTEATWPLISYIRVNHRLAAPGVPSAVRTLGAIGDTEAVPSLLEVLEDSTDAEVQIALVETLGRIGGPMAFDPVEKAARSEDWRLRAKAATALATLGDDSVIPTLALGLEDENWWVRRNSAASLSHFPQGVEVLYAALLSPDPFARDAASEALAEAGEVLAARSRIESNGAEPRDFDLVNHVDKRLVPL